MKRFSKLVAGVAIAGSLTAGGMGLGAGTASADPPPWAPGQGHDGGYGRDNDGRWNNDNWNNNNNGNWNNNNGNWNNDWNNNNGRWNDNGPGGLPSGTAVLGAHRAGVLGSDAPGLGVLLGPAVVPGVLGVIDV
jgi:hypothetical protein